MLRVYLIVFSLTSFFACENSSTELVDYDSAVSNFTVNKDLNYNQVLVLGLQLDDIKATKVKNILTGYRKNTKDHPDKKNKLKRNRDKKLARVLNETQMAQRKYINSKYYNNIPNYPTHPANVQSQYKLTDAQVMKLIEIEYLFIRDKDLTEKKNRLKKLLGVEKAAEFLNSKGIVI